MRAKGQMPIDAATRAADDGATGRPAHEVLAWSRSLLDPALRDAVASLPASMRQIAGYHLGWWDACGSPTDGGGGKAIRPALALLSAAVVSGAPADAVPFAVAVELVHNFSLLHDDVMDGDDFRRHRPTAWRVFGLGNAILAGDALLTLAFEVLRGFDRAGDGQPLAILCATIQALIDGQHADIAFESKNDVDLGDCVRMAQGKTGALLDCACSLGALAGGGSPEQVAHLSRFGSRLGLAFQVVDDLLGMWGDPASTGKPAHSDLRNRKKSLPIVAALTSGTAEGDELARWFQREQATAVPELVRAATLVEAAGGRQWCQSRLEALQADALRHLLLVQSTGWASAELITLLSMVVTSQTR